MSSFAFLLVCVQACLIQAVFGCPNEIVALAAPAVYSSGLSAGCGSFMNAGPTGYGYGIPQAAGSLVGAGINGAGVAGAYGGVGEGYVAAEGQLGVAGSTLVAGEVPVGGLVAFNGILPAAGTVSIAGNCGCGCANGPFFY